MTPTYSTSDYELWLSRRLAAHLPVGDMALLPDKQLPMTRYGLDVLTGAFTVIGEARGLSFDGKIAVAHSFNNRHLQRPERTIASLCLAPWQYSCWEPRGGEKNYVWLMALVERITTAIGMDGAWPQSSPMVREAMYLVGGVLSGTLADNTHGSTHYYVKGTPTPHWAEGRTPAAVIGPHLFFSHIAW